MEFLTATSQQLIKMYLRRKEEEEEEEQEEEMVDIGRSEQHIQISYKLGYIQVNCT